MKTKRVSLASDTFLVGCLVGVAGGLAEILWITVYGALTGSEIDEVARSISAVVSTFVAVAPLITEPVVSGIAIHMVAAIGLGIALAFLITYDAKPLFWWSGPPFFLRQNSRLNG